MTTIAASPPAPAPLRPTFERYVPGLDAKGLGARIAATLEGTSALPYRRTESHFLVWLPDGERRLWSPWLHLDVHDADDAPDGSDACRLFGRFHPAPSLWTAVMLGSLALATTAAGGALFAYSQWLVGEPASGLWLTAGALVGLAAVLLSSRIGQARARGQMTRLVDFVDRCAGV